METRASALASVRVYFWVGLAVAGLGVVQLFGDGLPDVGPVALLAAIASGGAVALLPRAPLWASLGITVSVVAMVLAIEVPVFATFLAAMITAFTLARYSPLRRAVLGFAALLLAVVAAAVPEVNSPGGGVFGLVYPIFYFGGSAALGWVARQRARHTQSLQEVAAALERERHQLAALAAAAERERLASDLHDVVSHGVSLMVVQAEAAREVLSARPGAAAAALDTIADTGRAAMRDLHRMLGVLRADSTDLDPLAARTRAAGIDVQLEIDPDWQSWEEHVRVALFRVAQEAITNTIRHADGATAVAIRVTSDSGEAELEVRDDGTGAKGASTGLGTGLSGLQDRLAALGGRVEATTVEDGFVVRATLPLAR